MTDRGVDGQPCENCMIADEMVRLRAENEELWDRVLTDLESLALLAMVMKTSHSLREENERLRAKVIGLTRGCLTCKHNKRLAAEEPCASCGCYSLDKWEYNGEPV